MPLPNVTTASGSGRTKRIDWTPNIQAIIRRLYLEEGVTLDNLPQRMREFGFRASRRSYCSKLREWGWRRKKKETGRSVSPEPMQFEEEDPPRDLGREAPVGTTSSLKSVESRAGSDISMVDALDPCHSIAGLTCHVCFGCAIAMAVTESDSEWTDSRTLSMSIF